MQTTLNLRDAGIKRAVDHADKKNADWSKKAYSFLKEFIYLYDADFMGEDVRTSSAGIVPVPPSKRAWGSVILKAAKDGLIEKIGYQVTTNPKAHRAIATVWKRTNKLI